MYKRINVNLSGREIQLLELINKMGPCSSQEVHQAFHPEENLLLVMRSLHSLVQMGFLQRVIINKKQLYRTSRKYSFVKAFLGKEDSL